MRVVGAGFGRTGTLSLKVALEQLGFAPCHHMEALFANRHQVPTWQAAARGEPVDWVAFLDGWDAAVDFPAAFYWRELAAAFPDAKVILTVRDPARWYESFASTILPMNVRFPERHVVPYLPMINMPWLVTRHPLMRRIIDATPAEAARLFEEANAEVVRAIPADRLLVYEVAQGWEPLCTFLGLPVPDAPFPRVNDAQTFRRRTNVVSAISWTVLLAPVVALAAVIYAVFG